MMNFNHAGAWKNGKERPKRRRGLALLFSLLLLVGVLVPVVCDLSISGRLTWSLFPVLSIPFVWLVFFPVILRGQAGIAVGLLALSACILPFLYGLDHLIQDSAWILPIGGRMAAVGVAFLWIVFSLFRCWKKRKRLAAAVSCLMAIPGCVVANLMLSEMLGCPMFDWWDFLSLLILTVLSLLFFLLDHKTQKSSS